MGSARIAHCCTLPIPKTLHYLQSTYHIIPYAFRNLPYYQSSLQNNKCMHGERQRISTSSGFQTHPGLHDRVLILVYKPVLFPSFALPSSFNFSEIYRAGATERSCHTLNAISVCSLILCSCKYRAVVVLGRTMVLVQSR